MRENKLKKIFKEGKVVVNGWLQIPSSFSAEVMANQSWDSLTIDMQHGAVDYPNALQMLQAISTTDVVPMTRVNWNEPGQIMKILDAGSYGVICPMISNREQAEKFVQACLYPQEGYRSFGPIRGLLYGGNDYAKHANKEILKLAMIENREALNNLDKIMSTPGLDGIYIGPADLSFAIGTEPGFDKEKSSPTFPVIENVLKHAKKNNIVAGIHNATPEYATKMIEMGFQFITVGSDQRYMSAGAQSALENLRKVKSNKKSKIY